MVVNMVVNLKTMLKIARKNSSSYDVNKVHDGTNIVRIAKGLNGTYVSRAQSFDKAGNLVSTERSCGNYSIYTEPSNGLLSLRYFTKIDDPKSFSGYRFEPEYAETSVKNLGDIRAFYKSQANNLK